MANYRMTNDSMSILSNDCETTRKDIRTTEESSKIRRTRQANNRSSKPLIKNKKRKKERTFNLDPSDISIDRYMQSTEKTKPKVSRNNNTLRSTNQWRIENNPNSNTSSTSDYLFVLPISEIGYTHANIIKRLNHIKKFNSLINRQDSQSKMKFKKVGFESPSVERNINREKTNLYEKEKRDVDSFNILKQNLVAFVSNTFLNTGNRTEENQNKGVNDMNAVPPKRSFIEYNKISYRNRAHGRKSYRRRTYSGDQQVCSDSSVKEVRVLSSGLLHNLSNDYNSESQRSILTHHKPRNKNNNTKKSRRTYSKKKTIDSDLKDADLESDVVILNASDSQFFKISDFLKIKESRSSSKSSKLKGKVIYEIKRPERERAHKAKAEGKTAMKETSQPVRFPLDSFRDILVFSRMDSNKTNKTIDEENACKKDTTRAAKNVSNQMDNYLKTSDQTSKIIPDKKMFNASKTTELSKRSNNPIIGQILDKNYNQEIKASTTQKQKEYNLCVSKLTSRNVSNICHKQLKNQINEKGLSKNVHAESCYDVKTKHILYENSNRNLDQPELDRIPSQNLKRKQSHIEDFYKSNSNKSTIYSGDIKNIHGKKSAKSSIDRSMIQPEYSDSDPLTRTTSYSLDKHAVKPDTDTSGKMLSDRCTLNEIEINNTKYSRFEINPKDSSSANSAQSKLMKIANDNNGQQSKNSKTSVSTAVQTDLHFTDLLEKERKQSKETESLLIGDLYEHVYMDKHVRSQIMDKTRPEFKETGHLKSMEDISNNESFYNEVSNKTSNISILSDEILVPTPIVSEPGDFFEQIITFRNKGIILGEPNCESEMHNYNGNRGVQSSLLHPDSEKQLNNIKPIKELINNTTLENEMSDGIKNQVHITAMEHSNIRRAKYSANKLQPTGYDQLQFPNNEIKTISYESLTNLRKTEILTKFISENKDDETNEMEHVPYPSESDTKNYNGSTSLFKKSNLGTISNIYNKALEPPVALGFEGRMYERSAERKTKYLQRQSLVDMNTNCSRLKDTRSRDSGLLSGGKIHTKSMGDLFPKNINNINEGINLPRSLPRMNRIERTDECDEKISAPLAKQPLMAINGNLSHQSSGNSKLSAMLRLEEKLNLSGCTLLDPQDMTSKNDNENTTPPPSGPQSLIETYRNNSAYGITRGTNSAKLIGSRRSEHLSSYYDMLSGKSPENHEGMKCAVTTAGGNEIPNLMEKDKSLNGSVLLEENEETDMARLNSLEEPYMLPIVSQSSSLGHSYSKDFLPSRTSINKSILTKPIIEEGSVPSKGDRRELIKQEQTYDEGDIREPSVHHIFDKVSFNYNQQSISDTNISVNQPDLKASRSNLSSFDQILLNISIKKKPVNNLPKERNLTCIPFKKSLILLPKNHKEENVDINPKDPGVKSIERFYLDPPCLNEVSVIKPTSKEIQCSLGSETPGERTSQEISIVKSTPTENALNDANNSSQQGHEEELGQKVQNTRVGSNSECESRTRDNSDMTSQTSQMKSEKSKKTTKKSSKRKLNRVFLCNYATHIPFVKIIRELATKNIVASDKQQKMQLFTRFLSCSRKHMSQNQLASFSHSLNQLKNHCFGKQKKFT